MMKCDFDKANMIFTVTIEQNPLHYNVMINTKTYFDVSAVELEMRSYEKFFKKAIQFSIHGVLFYFMADCDKKEVRLVAMQNISSLTIKIDGSVHYQSDYKANNDILLALGNTYCIKINKKSEFSFDCYYIN